MKSALAQSLRKKSSHNKGGCKVLAERKFSGLYTS